MARRPEGTDHTNAEPDAGVDALSYRDAVTELEEILRDLEDDAADIDQLSQRVRRAASLIRLCQDRIAGARLEVEHVVADLALGVTPTGTTATPDDSDDDLEDGPAPEDDVDGG